jgi:hypothetical protein
VAIEGEVQKMHRWLERNPGRRMTKRFMERWLDKADAEIVSVPGNGQKEDKSCTWLADDYDPTHHRKYNPNVHGLKEEYALFCETMKWEPIYE